ncbi:MAG: UDP-N-acetylmuramoyl-tripeptide--D-alanyl-D-alanine ligase [Candidatus Paceibacterota bacterium]
MLNLVFQFWPLIVLFVLFFWLVSRTKAILFWTYLWQLKNYHFGRFWAHFSTNDGRQSIYNKLILIKIIFLAVLIRIIYSLFFQVHFLGIQINEAHGWSVMALIFMLYSFEGLYSLRSFFKKQAKLPEFTSKIIFLLPLIFIPLAILGTVLFSLAIKSFQDNFFNIFTNSAIFSLIILAFDLVVPIVVSVIILFFQPITIILRNKVIEQAMEKIKSLENLTIIGITGSFGKSSVKNFLKTVLSESFRVVATEKNKNSEMGISETILNQLNNEHEIFICEMGAYNRGGIKLLSKITRPKIGILTGIGNQHLATFGSQKNITRAKMELIQALPEEGLAILNWDSEPVRDNFKHNKNCLKYGLNPGNDIWADDIKIEKFSLSFTAVFKTGDKIKIKLNLSGGHNIINLLPVIALAKRLGMENNEILAGLEKISSDSNGLKLFKNKDDFYVADSSYSANFHGVFAHLDYLKVWKSKKIFVMPSLIELGREASRLHHEMGKKIGENCDYLIIISGDYFSELKQGAKSAGMKPENIFLIPSPLAQYEKIKLLAKKDDLVFLEGRASSYLIEKLCEK